VSLYKSSSSKAGKRKAFFSEEKKQKTFVSLSRFYPAALARETNFF
jgi:hypothetical protein